jgi:hypothetical protein
MTNGMAQGDENRQIGSEHINIFPNGMRNMSVKFIEIVKESLDARKVEQQTILCFT